MPYHVGIGKVKAHKVHLFSFERGHDGIPKIKGRHFGLQVVGGYLGRRAHQAAFSLKFFLPSSRKEERYVGVLFGFGNPNLLFARFGQYFPQSIGEVIFVKNRLHSLKRIIVVGHGNVAQI